MAECDKTALEMERRFRQACQELEIPLPSTTSTTTTPITASGTTITGSGTQGEEKEEGYAAGAGAAAAAAYEAVDFRGALLGRTRMLRGLFEEVEALARADGVGEALAYYGDVRRFLRRGQAEAGGGGGEAEGGFFPVLCRVRAGERRTGGEGQEEGGEGGGGVLEIDWDAAMAGDAAAAFGGGGGEDAGVEIDWGATVEAAGDAGAVDWVEGEGAGAAGGGGEGGGGEIDWAIEVEEAGAGSEEPGALAPAASTAAVAGAVAGAGGASLLADAGLRGELLNDLLELQSFLRQRRAELAADEREGGVAFVGQYQGAHAALQQQSLGAVGAWGGASGFSFIHSFGCRAPPSHPPPIPHQTQNRQAPRGRERRAGRPPEPAPAVPAHDPGLPRLPGPRGGGPPAEAGAHGQDAPRAGGGAGAAGGGD